MEKTPVVVRRWRDNKKLVAMFVTVPYEGDAHKCPAFSEPDVFTWAKPLIATRQTVEVPRAEAEAFAERIPREVLRTLPTLTVPMQLEIWSRDRTAATLTLRLRAVRGKQWLRTTLFNRRK
jgi:hypothetical protein